MHADKRWAGKGRDLGGMGRGRAGMYAGQRFGEKRSPVFVHKEETRREEKRREEKRREDREKREENKSGSTKHVCMGSAKHACMGGAERYAGVDELAALLAVGGSTLFLPGERAAPDGREDCRPQRLVWHLRERVGGRREGRPFTCER